jgi:hypothetical protein
VGPGDTLGQAGRQAMTRKWSMLCFICNVYISDFSSQNLHTIVSYNAKSNHWVWKQKYFLLNKKTLLCCSYKFWSREIGFWLLTYKYVGSLKHVRTLVERTITFLCMPWEVGINHLNEFFVMKWSAQG